jgi:hypothetical protein
MDLGSLELQIFVSLTVVLGAAFVALLCDYLKGNNEQLREHNIELRVRKEEQERRMILDPASLISHLVPEAAQRAGEGLRPAAAAREDMDATAASQHALREVEMRAAAMRSRPRVGGSEEPADIPPMSRRRGARRNDGESIEDWVRPEVMARVARNAASMAGADGRDEERTELDKPLSAPEKWDIREELGIKSKGKRTSDETPAKAASEPQPPSKPLPAQTPEPPPAPLVRPLTVPSLSLSSEIQRVATNARPPMPPPLHSDLLEEVIAASLSASEQANTFVDVPAPQPEPQIERIQPAKEPATVPGPVFDFAISAGLTYEQPVHTTHPSTPTPVGAFEMLLEREPVAVHEPISIPETVSMEFVSADISPEANAAMEQPVPGPLVPQGVPHPTQSRFYGMGLPPSGEMEPFPSNVDLPWTGIQHCGDLMPGGEPRVEAPPVAPAPAVAETIDISALWPAEFQAPPNIPVPDYPDLLLPAGMHDKYTFNRLLSLPNPASGIVVLISLHMLEGAADAREEQLKEHADSPAIEKLMNSFLREGDFGCRIDTTEWVIIYSDDAAGINQRRVALISEKLWDFQLRQLGMTNINFQWGAVSVKSELLRDSVRAARDRCAVNAKKTVRPAARPETPRKAVNA